MLWRESGYFDVISATKPLLHLWSLGIEEQFYIFWPLAALAAWKARTNVLAVIVLLAGLSFALNVEYLRSDPVLTFYSPITRVWELLAGAALAQYERERCGAPSWLRCEAQSLIGCGLVLCGLIVTREGASFPGWWAAVSVVGAVAVINAGPHALLNRLVLSNRAMVAIGLISYPLYLWHWPFLSFARLIEGDLPSRGTRIALVIAAFACAVGTYFLIERPLRFGGRKREKTIGLAAVLMLLGVVGHYCYARAGLPNRPAVKYPAHFNEQYTGPLWSYTKNDTCLRRYSFEDASRYGWWFCAASKDEPPTALLLGNSFANQLYPGFATNPRLSHQSILSIGACPAWDVDPASKNTEPVGRDPCSGSRWYRQQQFIDNIIRTNQSLKYVIIDGIPPHPPGRYADALARRVDLLVKAGKKVIVFTPHLRLGTDIKDCLSRPFRTPKNTCWISAEERRQWDAAFAPYEHAVKQLQPDVKFFNQNDAFCDANGCSLIIDGYPVLRDQYDHLSEYASRRVADEFVRWAETNAPEILN